MLFCGFCKYSTKSPLLMKKHKEGFKNNHENCYRCHYCLEDFSNKFSKTRHEGKCFRRQDVDVPASEFQRYVMKTLNELMDTNKKLSARLHKQECELEQYRSGINRQCNEYSQTRTVVSNMKRSLGCLTTRVRNTERKLQNVTQDYAKKSWVSKHVNDAKPKEPTKEPEPIKSKPKPAPKPKPKEPTKPFLSVFTTEEHPSGRPWGVMFKRLIREAGECYNGESQRTYKSLCKEIEKYPGRKHIPKIRKRVNQDTSNLVRINYIFDAFRNFEPTLPNTSGSHRLAMFMKALSDARMIALNGNDVYFNGYTYPSFVDNKTNEMKLCTFISKMISNCPDHVSRGMSINDNTVHVFVLDFLGYKKELIL